MKKIIGIGNALTDILFQVDDNALKMFDLPKGSMQLVDAGLSAAIQKTFSSIPKSMVAGGSASNTINGIARLGGETAFIGKVGKDEIGAFYTADTKKNGVHPLLLTSDTPSGNCTVLVSPDGERTMCTYLGASCELSARDLTPDLFSDCFIFHIEGYLVQNTDLISKAAQMAKAAGAQVSIDLASYNVVEENLDFLKKLVKEHIDIVFANEEEAKAFTGLEAREALDTIAGLCNIAIVKTGKHGSYIKHNGQTIRIASIPAECIDSTGAGDLYAAGFLYGLSKNYDLEKCGKLGSLVAGKTVEIVGPKLLDSTWNAIKLQENAL